MDEVGSKFIIFISTISVYTGGKISQNKNPFDEKSIIDPEGFYGNHKFQAESICRDWSLKGINKKCAILRFSGIHGGGRKDGVIFNFIKKLSVSETIFIPSPYSRYSILNINDAVKSILLIIKKEKNLRNEIFNIAGGEDMELRQIAQKIKNIINSKSIIQYGNKHPKIRSMDIRKAQLGMGFFPETFDSWIKKEICEISKE